VLGVAVNVRDPTARTDGVALGHQHGEGDVAGGAVLGEVPGDELDRAVARASDLRAARVGGLAQARGATLLVGAGGEQGGESDLDQVAHVGLLGRVVRAVEYYHSTE